MENYKGICCFFKKVIHRRVLLSREKLQRREPYFSQTREEPNPPYDFATAPHRLAIGGLSHVSVEADGVENVIAGNLQELYACSKMAGPNILKNNSNPFDTILLYLCKKNKKKIV